MQEDFYEYSEDLTPKEPEKFSSRAVEGSLVENKNY